MRGLDTKKFDWMTFVPIFVTAVCVWMQLDKVNQAGGGVKEALDAINGNVFPTFVSLAVCEVVKSLIEAVHQTKTPSVSLKWCTLALIGTVLYWTVYVRNAARYTMKSTMAVTVLSGVYIILFFIRRCFGGEQKEVKDA